MTTTKLVYNGSVTTSFSAINAELKPGEEFYVPDGLAESFLQRPDVELATDHGMAESDDPKPIRTKSTTQLKPAAEAPEAK